MYCIATYQALYATKTVQSTFTKPRSDPRIASDNLLEATIFADVKDELSMSEELKFIDMIAPGKLSLPVDRYVL